eukprot:m.81239 g.81239  ORF g.81239 m.81239 type:complete len:217 (+) comp14865_c0_seq3:233-883(+)
MASGGEEYFTFKFILIGDSNVGKTSLVKNFIGDVHNGKNTVGVEFNVRHIEISGQKIRLQVWDTAGQERFRAVVRSYYRGAAGCIIVYDTTKRSSYNNVQQWYSDVKTSCHASAIMLVGNKCDLENDRDVTTEEASAYAKENGMLFLETSALSGMNVELAFLDMAQNLYKKVQEGIIAVGDPDSGVTHTSIKKAANVTVNSGSGSSSGGSGGGGCC